MEAGSRSLNEGARETARDRVEHGVPAAAVAPPEEPQLPLHVTRPQQLGQHELRQGGVAEIGVPFCLDKPPAVAGRRHNPPHSQCGSKQLGHAPEIEHLLGEHRAQGGDRGAVVTVLGVVVVLDHKPPVGRPSRQFPAPLAVEHDPGRELVRRGQHNGGHADGPQFVDAKPPGVDSDRWSAELRVPEVLADPQGAGILHRHLMDALVMHQVGKQAEALGDARDNKYLIGADPDPSVASQPIGDGGTQRRGTGRVAVAQGRGREVAEDTTLGTQPRRSGKGGQVGQTGRQVHPRRDRPQGFENASTGRGPEKLGRDQRANRVGPAARVLKGAATTIVPPRPLPSKWPSSPRRR